MEQPFYPGQRVVFIGPPDGFQSDVPTPDIPIGTETVVDQVRHFNKLKGQQGGIASGWFVGVVDDTTSLYFHACFAPITPREVEIDAAIIEQAEEMVSVKETVLEPVLN